MDIKKHRDLTIIKNNDHFIVIGCDSAGAIGEKVNDLIYAENEIVGKYTTRVALMEVLSLGCEIIAITNTLSVEMKYTGENIIKGIYDELELANIKKKC